MSLCFTVPGPPVGKQRPRTVRGRNGGVHTYTPGKTLAYEQHVKVVALAAGARRAALAPPYCIELAIWWPDRRRRDADNVLKSVMDALNGVVWADDCLVTRTVTEVMGVDRENARLEIQIESRGNQ